MPKTVSVSDAQLDELRRMCDSGASYQDMAALLGCCIDTVKRILHRHGIREFSTAKYVASGGRPKEDKWVRRCLACGKSKKLPRWVFICNACKGQHARKGDGGLPADWQWEW